MMNKIKFKNWKSKTKNRIIISFFVSLLMTIFLVTIFVKNISSGLTEYIAKTVNKENTLILKEAFSHSQNFNIDIDNLITVVKNSKEEITEVNFDMKASAKLLSSITGYMNDQILDYNYLGYRIDVPIGILFKNPLLTNVGPKIPIKVELADIALGNVKTVVKPFGINNALIEVYLDIILRTSVLYPFETIEENTSYSSLIASKIITGKVPDFFGGTINSKSDTINLPLIE